MRAVSSVVEHCLHTAGVAGSNPAPPTSKIKNLAASSGAAFVSGANPGVIFQASPKPLVAVRPSRVRTARLSSPTCPRFFAHHVQFHAQLQQDGGARVPQVVEVDAGNLCRLARSAKARLETLEVDGQRQLPQPWPQRQDDWHLSIAPGGPRLTRKADAMGLSSSLFLLSADDKVHALASTTFMRMLRREDEARVPDFAGQRVQQRRRSGRRQTVANGALDLLRSRHRCSRFAGCRAPAHPATRPSGRPVRTFKARGYWWPHRRRDESLCRPRWLLGARRTPPALHRGCRTGASVVSASSDSSMSPVA